MRLCSVAPGACPPLEPFYCLHLHFSPLMELHAWIVAFLSLSLGVNAIRKVKSLKGDPMLMPQTLAWHFSLRSMLIREPFVWDRYMLAYRIKLQQRSFAQRSQEAL